MEHTKNILPSWSYVVGLRVHHLSNATYHHITYSRWPGHIEDQLWLSLHKIREVYSNGVKMFPKYSLCNFIYIICHTREDAVLVTLLTVIHEVLGLNLGWYIGYPERGTLWYTSVPPGKTFISHEFCFPHPFQFNIYQSSYHSIVIQSDTENTENKLLQNIILKDYTDLLWLQKSYAGIGLSCIHMWVCIQQQKFPYFQ